FFVVVLLAIMGEIQIILSEVIKPIPIEEILLSNPHSCYVSAYKSRIQLLIKAGAKKKANQKHFSETL
ncbi:MAG: hypothetical protein IKN62_03760, partial [Elusimicrobia bacterium]|nr:hypothetical protein [Elusimicrobiota bacterium]